MFICEGPKLPHFLFHSLVMAVHPDLINNTVVTRNRNTIFAVNDLKNKNMSLSLDSSPWVGLKKCSLVGVPLVGFFISVPAWNKLAFLGASSE